MYVALLLLLYSDDFNYLMHANHLCTRLAHHSHFTSCCYYIIIITLLLIILLLLLLLLLFIIITIIILIIIIIVIIIIIIIINYYNYNFFSAFFYSLDVFSISYRLFFNTGGKHLILYGLKGPVKEREYI